MFTAFHRRRSAAATTPKSPGLRPRLAVGVAGLFVAAGLLSACGGSSGGGSQVATLPTTGVAAAQPAQNGGQPNQQTVHTQALAYSKCMRSHGISAFPDPDAKGNLAINGSAVGMNTAAFKTADGACRSLLPAAPPPVSAPQDRAAGLKYAQCMRQNGVTKFPDPNAGGGIDIDGATLGVDPNGPVFKKADDSCHKFLPGTTSQGSGS